MSNRIEYHEGDYVGDYGCQFLYEVEPHISPTRTYRRACFKCGYCGNKFEAVINDVRRNCPRSCGCYRKISKAKTHVRDITGQRYGKLTAIKRLNRQAKDNTYYWLCQCDCGNTTEINICDFGRIQSCGCMNFKSGGEEWMRNKLSSLNIEFIEQKTFEDCRSDKNSLLRFDFYIPKYNCCIEIDGKQHKEPVDRFGGKEAFDRLRKNDIIKNKYCEENNIFLIRVDYNRKINERQVIDDFKKVGII